mmetsp:Transcript_6364/g.12052  ORF Transcript_6364/g.12052 Transcript_6364/m.12052 type:complete len:249 (-) Transcript_6364:175-921(-)
MVLHPVGPQHVAFAVVVVHVHTPSIRVLFKTADVVVWRNNHLASVLEGEGNFGENSVQLVNVSDLWQRVALLLFIARRVGQRGRAAQNSASHLQLRVESSVQGGRQVGEGGAAVYDEALVLCQQLAGADLQIDSVEAHSRHYHHVIAHALHNQGGVLDNSPVLVPTGSEPSKSEMASLRSQAESEGVPLHKLLSDHLFQDVVPRATDSHNAVRFLCFEEVSLGIVAPKSVTYPSKTSIRVPCVRTEPK